MARGKYSKKQLAAIHANGNKPSGVKDTTSHNTGVKFYKTQSAQPVGEYKETGIDRKKRNADFRLLQVSPYVIKWKDGRVETVNKRKLDELQKDHPNYMTDF